MDPLKSVSSSIIDTTNMKPKDLKEEIEKIFSNGEENSKLS